ncbi:hypothetical protein ACTFJE_06060, partial [Klebsiella electrica]|uniref:hypothetical protein n=1 Tax=Klebsiella electrica TaxID=1259973 RepID=UPI003F77565E
GRELLVQQFTGLSPILSVIFLSYLSGSASKDYLCKTEASIKPILLSIIGLIFVVPQFYYVGTL